MSNGEKGVLRLETGLSCVSCSESFTGPDGVIELVVPQLRYGNVVGKDSGGIPLTFHNGSILINGLWIS